MAGSEGGEGWNRTGVEGSSAAGWQGQCARGGEAQGESGKVGRSGDPPMKMGVGRCWAQGATCSAGGARRALTATRPPSARCRRCWRGPAAGCAGRGGGRASRTRSSRPAGGARLQEEGHGERGGGAREWSAMRGPALRCAARVQLEPERLSSFSGFGGRPRRSPCRKTRSRPSRTQRATGCSS